MNDLTTPRFSHSDDRDMHLEIYAPQTMQWLYDTATGMVDEEIDVEVEATCTDEQTVFTLKCNRDDVGKLIGTKGHHARALRTLLQCRAGKEKCRYALDIIDYREGRADEATLEVAAE
jgi:predicted RNA-binding protein YlqC (UPF0109 family)